MKILLSGYHNPHFWTITEYMENAIRSLGHDLSIFDDRNHIIPGQIRRHVPWLHRLDLDILNRKFNTLASRFAPEIAFITGGYRTLPDTVNSLKKNRIRTILWTTDAPINFQPILHAAPHYDHIFCAGTEAIELLDQVGIAGARWLPFGCDPDLHHPLELSSEDQKQYAHDIVFMGSYYPGRAELFSRLTEFDLAIWGPGWDRLESSSPLLKHIMGSHTTPDQWLKIYSAAKIVLAAHYQDPEGRFPVYQASPRIFEALACGSFVISDRQRDVLALFKDGTHLVTFKSPDDLFDKMKYYLNNPSERKQISRLGREAVLRHHTYLMRIVAMLSSINDQ